MIAEKGSIGEFLAVCIGLLLMCVLLVNFLDSVGLMNEKAEVDQIARKYILRMETCGQLTTADRASLCMELENAGVSGISLEGTSPNKVPYGETITLYIKGKLRGDIEFYEKRVSTAKH